jgi:hypothetical protein
MQVSVMAVGLPSMIFRSSQRPDHRQKQAGSCPYQLPRFGQYLCNISDQIEHPPPVDFSTHAMLIYDLEKK